jgi:hypothetical protein
MSGTSQTGSVSWTQSRLIVVLGVWILFCALPTIAGTPSTIAGPSDQVVGRHRTPCRFEPDSVDGRASTGT